MKFVIFLDKIYKVGEKNLWYNKNVGIWRDFYTDDKNRKESGKNCFPAAGEDKNGREKNFLYETT